MRNLEEVARLMEKNKADRQGAVRELIAALDVEEGKINAGAFQRALNRYHAADRSSVSMKGYIDGRAAERKDWIKA